MTEEFSHVRIPIATWAEAVKWAYALHKEVCDEHTAAWKKSCKARKLKFVGLRLTGISITGPHQQGAFAVTWNFVGEAE